MAPYPAIRAIITRCIYIPVSLPSLGPSQMPLRVNGVTSCEQVSLAFTSPPANKSHNRVCNKSQSHLTLNRYVIRGLGVNVMRIHVDSSIQSSGWISGIGILLNRDIVLKTLDIDVPIGLHCVHWQSSHQCQLIESCHHKLSTACRQEISNKYSADALLTLPC